jgi:enoyl-CoA hydratase/carnithine racemase
MITDVVEDPVAVSRKLARACAAKSPDAIRGIKALVNAGWQLTEVNALALEAQLQGGIIGGRNQQEAMQANLARRKPDFID